MAIIAFKFPHAPSRLLQFPGSQPEVVLRQIHRGPDTGKWEVELHGFDYYNPITGTIESGDSNRIAMWMLDTDYDGRSL